MICTVVKGQFLLLFQFLVEKCGYQLYPFLFFLSPFKVESKSTAFADFDFFFYFFSQLIHLTLIVDFYCW